jgi:MinD superfamily P-loop ATPase
MNPFRIAIASGKGGTGKTFISTNLFNTLQKLSYHVALVDCDAEEPNDKEFITGKLLTVYEVQQKVPIINESMCTYCGKCSEYCNYNAIFFLGEQRMIRVMEDLCHGCGACSVACKNDAITEKDNTLGTVSFYKVLENSSFIEGRMKVGVHSPVSTIKAAIDKAKTAEIVLLDSPPGTSCPFIQTVAMSDFVILVTEPTPFGLSDLKQSVETVRNMNKRCGVIINRAGLGNNAVFNYLIEEQIPLLMSIPFDRNIATIYSKGELLTNHDSEWESRFNELYNTIYTKHGTGNN